MTQIKFSGMSWNGGTKIFGKQYSLKITPNKFEISKNKLPDFPFILGFAIIFDTIPFILVELPMWVVSGWITLDPFITQIITVFAAIGVVVLDIWLFYIVAKYFCGSQHWHGLEHKLIAAAEKNDVGNALNYSPINDRCGGTYLLSMVAYLLFSYSATVFVFNKPYGMLTITALFVVFEARVWHEYNAPGIKLGRWIQKKFTIREPTVQMVLHGVNAMQTLVDAEQG